MLNGVAAPWGDHEVQASNVHLGEHAAVDQRLDRGQQGQRQWDHVGLI
jgi:hypothetical protein